MKLLILLLNFHLIFRSSGLDLLNEGQKPNFVVIVTDDQDVVLNGMTPMTNVQQLLANKGVTFQNAFTSSPLCCPSRATILSGLYAHNHKTVNNSISGNCYGNHWKKTVEPNSISVALQENGYDTFFAGKYLNEYKTKVVPPGWTNFHGLHGNSKYYNYSITENGKVVNYTDEYLTDLLGKKLINYISESKTKPFFAMIAPPAPHEPFTPADRHVDKFAGVKAPRTPNYNMLTHNLDKHWLISTFGKTITEPLLSTMDLFYRKRWETLLAVDEIVANVVKTLEDLKQIDNTYIIYTSDNGYHIGQFAQPFDKRQPYETDIRVPFIIRGPQIPEKTLSVDPIALVDLLPTIKDFAGIEFGSEDGISIRSFSEKPNTLGLADKKFHRQLLVQYWGEGTLDSYNPLCPWAQKDRLSQCTVNGDCHCQDAWNNTFSCVRHFAYRTNKVYCEFKDNEQFVEAYDLDEDEYQITNLGFKMLPIELAMYSLALQNLTKCKGESCQHTQF